MDKILFIFSFILSFLFHNCEEIIYSNETFLEWGLRNNLKLSPYLDTVTLPKNKIKFIAKTDIPNNKDLLIIPYSLMFNLNKALELINSKTLHKQNTEFQKIYLNFQPKNAEFRKEESFLSYILYLVKHKPKKYHKTKFVEIYQKYLEFLQKYYPKSPLFYQPNQIQYLAGTYLDRQLDDIRIIYQDEVDVFTNKAFNKKVLDFDKYAHYRLAINKYGLNIFNHWTLVPFLNFFNDDCFSYNANYTIEKNGDVRIYSLKEIKEGDEIILFSEKITNAKKLIMEGKTSEKLVDYFTEYPISAFSPGLYYQYGINDKAYFESYYVNILEDDFDSQMLKIYKEHAELLHGDGSDAWAYDVVEINLNSYKEHFEGITLNKIYDIYYDTDDRINIERIIRGEGKIVKDIYDKANKIIDKFLDKLEKEEREKKMKKEKDKKNSDL